VQGKEQTCVSDWRPDVFNLSSPNRGLPGLMNYEMVNK
jgi:hypothetical protein